MAEKPQQQEIKIDLPAEVAAGKYSNLAIIVHNPQEVCLDFIAVVPNSPSAPVVSRIIMTPENAKNLLRALRDNIANYEATFGEIRPKNPMPNNAKGDLPNPFMA